MLFQVITSCDGCGHDATCAPMSVSFFSVPVIGDTVQSSGNSFGPVRMNASALPSGVAVKLEKIHCVPGVICFTACVAGSRRNRCAAVFCDALKRMPSFSQAIGPGFSSKDFVRSVMAPPAAGITAMRVFV